VRLPIDGKSDRIAGWLPGSKLEEKATILAVGSIHTIFQNTSIFRYVAEMISRQNVNYALHVAEQKCTK
jgi:hypothetical protein